MLANLSAFLSLGHVRINISSAGDKAVEVRPSIVSQEVDRS